MQNNGIASEIYSLINNEDVRPTANLVISKSTAYEYLNNSKPNLEKLTTQYYENQIFNHRPRGIDTYSHECMFKQHRKQCCRRSIREHLQQKKRASVYI